MDDAAVDAYRSSRLRGILFVLALAALCLLAAGMSIGTGPYGPGVAGSYSALWDHLTGSVADEARLLDYIVWEKRLPRALAAVVAGAGLAACGCAMQSLLRNPLADAYTTGISAGAGFGATLAFTAGLSMASGPYAVILNTFVFALIPMAVVIAVSGLRGGSSSTMIMVGISMTYLFNAAAAVYKIAADPNALAALYSWQLGSVSGIGWQELPFAATAVAIGCTVLWAYSRRMDAVSSGDEFARSIGVDPALLRGTLLAVVALVTAVIVSLTGLIGFVGLVGPHICRLVIGSDGRVLLPASMAFGALLLTAADVAGRCINPPAEIQVGILTAFMGAPLFLYLAAGRRRIRWHQSNAADSASSMGKDGPSFPDLTSPSKGMRGLSACWAPTGWGRRHWPDASAGSSIRLRGRCSSTERTPPPCPVGGLRRRSRSSPPPERRPTPPFATRFSWAAPEGSA